MAFAQIIAPHDLRDVLAALEALTPADLTPYDVSGGFDDWFTFEVSVDGQDYAGLMIVYPDGRTVFQDFDVDDPGGPLTAFLVYTDGPFELGAGPSLTETFEAESQVLPGNWYYGHHADSVFEGFGGSDTMIGQGIFRGRGGSDVLALQPYIDTPDSGARSVAVGNGGDDFLLSVLSDARMLGGRGEDVLVVEAGRAVLEGGADTDRFIFASGFDQFAGGPIPWVDTPVRARIRDFDPGAETITLAWNGDPATDVALSDLVGDVTLDAVGDFTVDGVRVAFSENRFGDAVVRRTGIDSEGNEYDERVRIMGSALEDIAAGRIVLNLGADDIFALA